MESERMFFKMLTAVLFMWWVSEWFFSPLVYKSPLICIYYIYNEKYNKLEKWKKRKWKKNKSWRFSGGFEEGNNIMENNISEKLTWEWCERWIGSRKAQGKKSSLWANKGQKKCGKERTGFRGLVVNGLMGKKEKKKSQKWSQDFKVDWVREN